ncbi:MAG: glycosyltransferase family 4 protein [Croceibacterium sp.]
MRSPMRILYPVLWGRPGRHASQAQTVATVAALSRAGHDVTLMLPQDKRDPSLSAADLRAWFSVEGDFRVLQRPSRWQGDAVLKTVMWLRQVFSDLALTDADVLYSRVPAMVGIGGRSPLPFATDHYRPWPDIYPAIRPYVRRTANSPLCLAYVIHSHYAADAYLRAGVPADRLLVAHNGFDSLGEPIDKAAARKRLGLPPDRAIAVYAGRINAEKGLDTLLDLADRRPDVLFVLVGSEGHGPIEQAAAQRTNVRIEPWAEPTALPPWLFAADVLLIPPSSAPLKRFASCVLPIKLFTYLAAGRPILAPDAPDTRELLVDGQTALLVEPDRPEAFVAALDRLLGDQALAQSLSSQARRLSESLSWDARAQKVAAFVTQRLAQFSGAAGTGPALAANLASSSNW